VNTLEAQVLDILLYDGFGEHASDGGRYAAELEAAAKGEVPAKHLVQFAKVGVHTIGEHLGDWPRAKSLADRLLNGRAPTAETAKAWGHLFVAATLSGDVAGAADAEIAFCQGVGADFRAPIVEMKFMLVAALVGCGRASEAAAIYQRALDLARTLGEAAPHRAIAVASNNLASELLEAPTRTPAEAELMQRAAAVAHEFWLKCGDWLNDARADYLEAMVANVLGDHATGLAHADRALALIAANGGAAVDETFLHLTRAHALRLAGDEAGAASELELSDNDALGWDDDGLVSWYAEERSRVMPDAPELDDEAETD
jgi:tetratricopeptide (TPR) repeat protein